jgi:hypothetical protein
MLLKKNISNKEEGWVGQRKWQNIGQRFQQKLLFLVVLRMVLKSKVKKKIVLRTVSCIRLKLQIIFFVFCSYFLPTQNHPPQTEVEGKQQEEEKMTDSGNSYQRPLVTVN